MKGILNKYKELIILCVMIICYLAGYAICIFGIKYGQDVAMQLTKPEGRTVWSTSQDQMTLASCFIVMLGGLWIVTAHVLFILLSVKFLFHRKTT